LHPYVNFLGKICVENEHQNQVFEEAKNLLQLSSRLVHYDPSKELVSSCDASPTGLSVVLLHDMGEGNEKPIAYASRTLAPAQKTILNRRRKD
jgi:hypothetical protein